MATAFVIGGTGFVGRHVVEELLEQQYDVTVFARGASDRPADPRARVSFATGDRTQPASLAAAAEAVAPDIVVDCALFQPDDAMVAMDLFADVEAYVYVSSGGVYAGHEIPKRESDTPLHAYGPDHAGDRSMASYGPRKAECDRIVTAAGSRDVPAMSVRPTMVYGPKSTDGTDIPTAEAVSWAPAAPAIQSHHDYWIDRVDRFDRVVVPGDGTAIWHRVYVEDVARAVRLVAEAGTPGEAYNVADERILTMEDVIQLIAATLDTSVEVVHASRRELEAFGLAPDDFVLYHHIGSNYPHILSTCKLASLGWQSTPIEVAMERTVEESLASDRDGSHFDPGRPAEERFLESVVG